MYIAVLAVLSLSGLAYAQTAPELGSDGLAVTTSLENGIVKIAIKMDVTNPTASSEDAIKKAVAEALKASGTNTNYAKAITASIAAVKAAVKDVNYPAKGTVSLNISLKNTVLSQVLRGAVRFFLSVEKPTTLKLVRYLCLTAALRLKAIFCR
ncbi:MAG: hypothetical protein ACLUKN_03070 [Bacilli bacterium]